MSLDRAIPPAPYDVLPPVPSFYLSSPDITEGARLDLRHVSAHAGGHDISPALRWSGFPAETKGFVVTCFDPDAPTASGFWHWCLAGLPASVTELAQGTGSGTDLPAGAFHIRNDVGGLAYAGAAPPAGDRVHRYYFAVHAVDTDDLGLDSSATPAGLGFTMTFHVLARAVLMATYQQA